MNLSKTNRVLLLAVEKGYKFAEDNKIVGPSGKTKTIRLDKDGYPYIGIHYENNRGFPVTLHKLKAYFLYGNEIFKNGIEIRHKDNNKLNLNDSNIILGTHAENQRDLPKEQVIKIATKAASHLRKFTEGDIDQIKNKRKNGYLLSDLSKEYKCSKSTIFYIINNKTYKNRS